MELTSEQQALRESVADLLRRQPPQLDPDKGDNSAELWHLLSGIGVAGIGIPEHFGGVGAGPVEQCLVAEQLGRALAPSPLLGSAILAGQAILAAGDADSCERLLPAVSAGQLIAALAWTDRSGRWDPALVACHATDSGDGGWTLTGTAYYVLDGASAEVLIVAAMVPNGSVGLFEVVPHQLGVDRQAVATMDQTRSLAVVKLATVTARPLGQAPAPGLGAQEGIGTAALARAKAIACIALAAEQVGAAARALELTADYTKQRVQFGRSIASFQVIAHRLAESHVLVESARSLSYRAAQVAASLDSPGHYPAAELTLAASAAKAYCSQALSEVAAEMIQLHGAIGVTWEYDAHRYFKRAHGASQLFGAPQAHQAEIAATLLGPPPPT